MSALLHYRWHGDVARVTAEGDNLAIEVPNWRPLRIGPLAPALATAIRRLGDGAPLDAMRAEASIAGPAAVERLDFFLGRFRQARLIEWALRRNGQEIATFGSLTSGFGPAEGPMPPGRHVLSRFAYLRRDGWALVLDSAEAPCRAVLHDAALAALGWLAQLPETPPDATVAPIVETLWRMGFLEPAEGPEPQARASWEFADRLLHVASRLSRDADVVGGTYRFKGQFTAPPAAKPPMSSERVALPAPDFQTLAGRSRPLAAISEARRSNRAWAAAPVPLPVVGELLWRVARVKQRLSAGDQELLLKPIPSGGAIHELEWYLAADAIGSLPAGLYHYDGFDHALYRLPDSAAAAKAMGERAALAAAQPGKPPPVLVILASRLPRLAWKYQGIAYRLTLLNAGAAVGNLYLAATDMGLACSAIGTGDPRPFERVTGLSSWEETPVAELALGLSG